MHDILTLDGAVHALCTKETKLTNLEIIKEKSAHFVTQRGFHRSQGGQRGTEMHIIS